MADPRCVALIPARGGSRRVPGKNIKPLAGHPLLAYTIAAAQQSGVFTNVWVSTEDDEIYRWCMAEGVSIAPRPAEMAADHSPDIEWVAFMLNHSLVMRPEPQAFSILRPTSPFRTADTIRRAWALWLERGHRYDSLRAVEPTRATPYKAWTLNPENGSGPLTPFVSPIEPGWLTTAPAPFVYNFGPAPAHSSPTQTLPKVYQQNASLEIAHVKTVIEQHSISGARVMPFFTEGYEGLDINSPEDWILAEALVEKGLARLPEVE